MEQNSAQTTETTEHKNKNWYDKYHKLILILPVIALIFSVAYLWSFTVHNGDIVLKDVSLTGGTTVTVFDGKADIDKLKESQKVEFSDLSIRKISDIRTGSQRGFILETKADAQKIKSSLENYLGYNLTKDNSSIEFTGATLSSGFYQQLRSSIIAAFLLMACVVFVIFAKSKKIKSVMLMLTFLGVGIVLADVPRMKGMMIFAVLVGAVYGLIWGEKEKDKYLTLLLTCAAAILILLLYPGFILMLPLVALLVYFYIKHSIPSFAVIACAFADIAMTIVVVDMIGITLSIAGIIAFLMLIGYSVDTDILLTSRVLKEKEGSVNKRVWGAFKTGITMTLTSIAAIGISLVVIYNLSETLRQIFMIILIGLGFDIFNTWITNAAMVKWYADVKGGIE